MCCYLLDDLNLHVWHVFAHRRRSLECVRVGSGDVVSEIPASHQNFSKNSASQRSFSENSASQQVSEK